ncbi:hypothetical protein EsVE80_15550 [Enterococcus saigonensis]|uniref:DUF998 domain-containing protein n=1 Tax=Enterococcus saigonensis TaxID=1805431 RepID=A0A679IIY1_9ENTE|nr:hypothetical protein [Enterococcus saigonensis]BCA86032.1 hypothetical protein EsVE80_15550 [Enterococcus saigonensis]
MTNLKLLKYITVACGFTATILFVSTFCSDYLFDTLATKLSLNAFGENSNLGTLFNHLFILFTVIFSGLLYYYCKQTGKIEFKEATSFYFIAFSILFLRTFLPSENIHSFFYLLSVGIQILTTLMALFFFLIAFLNRKYPVFFAILMGIDILIYLGSVLYSVLLTDFSLPNFGSIVAATINITFFSFFFLNMPIKKHV